ncbi:MAG TPA: hypothetical protein DE315_02250 [Candidatus Omnitrophica bacterium]|nr:MAG: hypothetical protein A2Y05_03210 [Omnitrophica WOR_2 bacterium GWA2_53_43]HBO97423.1 hypothetical protein [Candidatus Omnitrophota bacterium]HCI44341.1 hypothetical protein [Candidatus Omnitrophota bacterium]
MAQHRRSILIIILVSLVTFGNSVSNGFVGDDYILVVENSFYDSWGNFPELFSPSYITESDDVFNKDTYSHTGSIAYRPVLSATFFLDYWLWQRVAFGYHLHNVILHVLNAVLVYFILFLILKDPALSLFGAVLFAVHPLKSEAVCAIGYRGDLLAALFFLLAFVSYMLRERCGAGTRKVIEALSHVALFLALFSKESAIVFLGILAAYDVLVKKEKTLDVLKHFYGRYLGYVLITLSYLYIYFYVFRNSAMDNARLLGGNVFTHATFSVDIFVQYLAGFILPLTVKVIPPLYAPPAAEYAAWAGLALFIFLTYQICRKEKTAVFFVAWFLLTLVPVSNAVPLVSPMAYRFLYLPSVGFLAAAGILLSKAGAYLDRRLQGMRVGTALRWGIVALCVIQTMALNMAWKNNLMMATMMVKDFPRFPTGYLHLGMEYFKKGDVPRAREALQTGFENGLQDARGYHYMGLCYFNDWERARPYYEESIRQFPYYALSYVGLGRIDVLGGHYAEAIPCLEKAIALSPSYAGYGYLIQAYLRTDRPDDALAVYRQAQNNVREKSRLDSLEKFIQEGSNLRGPVDIGI